MSTLASLKTFIASAVPFRVVRREPFGWLNQDKKRLIDFAFEKLSLKSFADLGGVWNVDGGYTFYALQKYSVERAVLVDTDFTETVREQKALHSNLRLIEGNFGSEDVAHQVGEVDTVILFDTLLHQVAPDWDKVLDIYAPQTRSFIIFNQQFTSGTQTVRLLDLGEEEYFRNVPGTKEEEPYRSVFAKMYETHPQHQRIYRDIHNIWQWGITDNDLSEKMTSLGFSLQLYKNVGQFGTLPNFENHCFLFIR